MQEIFTPGTPKPAGHNTQVIVHNGMVFVSGQRAGQGGQGSGVHHRYLLMGARQRGTRARFQRTQTRQGGGASQGTAIWISD